MLILTKLKFRFSSPDGDVFISAGNNVIETAPDWIQRDPLFPSGIQDGTLVLVEKTPFWGSGVGTAANDEAAVEPAEPEVKKTTADKKK
ncbi:MAG: hypothetical protein SPI35_08055 [Porphyromonas sp.]|nr:hypothetical protein [Porphyromonas sp.]